MDAQKKIGSYIVLRRLGAGGMGEVYLAEDSRLGRKVALKVLTPQFAADEERMRRFMQEAKAASALNHPNILTVYEVGERDQPFIATEFVDGRTLRDLLESGAMSLARVLDVATQLTSAVAAAHQAGIIHRDIKPENVMIRTDGYVKLLDFGVAKLAAVPSAELSGDAQTRMDTQTGMVVGTLNYMSPEQARGLEVDARSDVFAIGVLIYEMVTGQKAFSGDTASDRLASVLKSEPAPMTKQVPGTPPALELVVRKALAKNKDERYASAKNLLAALQDIRAEKKSSSKLWVIGAAVILLAAALAVLPRLTQSRPEQRPPPAAAVAALKPVAFSYWITVQKYRNGKPYEDAFRLAREINFEKDYRIRLHFTSPRPGFLYLLSESPDSVSTTTPYNLIAAARIEGNQEKQVPEQSWFQFDDEKGTEKVWIVWSSTSVPELDAGVKFINKKDQGSINDAGIRDAIRGFLKSHVNPSELEKDDRSQATRIRNNNDPVVYLLNLEHN